MDYFEKGSPVRQNIRQDVYNTTSFIRKVYAKDLNAENFSTSTPIPEFRAVDIDSLFTAVMEEPFNVEDWKASFTTVMPANGATINGVFDTNGDFSTEVSNWKAVGIVDTGEEALMSILGSESFTPVNGNMLGGIEISNSFIMYDYGNVQWTYKYEEAESATGSDPMYLHDFTFNIESTQINGYVVIGADDSIIANQFDGFTPSTGGGGGSCDASINFNIGLSSFDATSNLIGVDTFLGNDFNGSLEIRSVEGSPVATSYAGPAQNLDFYMPVIDQSASDTYEYILTLIDDNTGCVYCGMAVGNPSSITLVLNDPMQSQIANNDGLGMGCGTMNPPLIP